MSPLIRIIVALGVTSLATALPYGRRGLDDVLSPAVIETNPWYTNDQVLEGVLPIAPAVAETSPWYIFDQIPEEVPSVVTSSFVYPEGIPSVAESFAPAVEMTPWYIFDQIPEEVPSIVTSNFVYPEGVPSVAESLAPAVVETSPWYIFDQIPEVPSVAQSIVPAVAETDPWYIDNQVIEEVPSVAISLPRGEIVPAAPEAPVNIHITSPKSTAVWQVGSTQQVTWWVDSEYQGYSSEDIKVEIFAHGTDGDTLVATAADSIIANFGVATYTVEQITKEGAIDYYVLLSSVASDGHFNQQSEHFQIVNP